MKPALLRAVAATAERCTCGPLNSADLRVAVFEAADELERLQADLAKNQTALIVARDTIKIWHNLVPLNLSPATVQEMWRIYQQSPEMQVINNALPEAARLL